MRDCRWPDEECACPHAPYDPDRPSVDAARWVPDHSTLPAPAPPPVLWSEADWVDLGRVTRDAAGSLVRLSVTAGWASGACSPPSTEVTPPVGWMDLT